MADLQKMDRTWLCSVVFMDIVNYSSQSVDQQMKWKQRFNGYLAEAIHDVPEAERVILDTGDGAAVCFLGAPEAAMFAGLQLCQSFIIDEREHRPGLCVRVGINLGPVRLIRDVNGALNAIGDGINAGQRIMSFAATNQILVSQSFFEVVSRLDDDYKAMFQWKGVEADKHVREHTVYRLLPPGTERPDSAPNAEAQKASSSAAHPGHAAASPRRPVPRSRSIWMAAGGGAVVAVLTALGAWLFFLGPAGRTSPNRGARPVVQAPAIVESPAPSAKAAEPATQAYAVSRADISTSAARPGGGPVAPVKTALPINAAPMNAPAPPPRSPVESASAVTAPPDSVKLLQDGKAQFANHNMEAARESFEKAADAGNAQAMVLMGTFYSQGLGGPKSDSDAVRMFRRAADLGDARGMYNLGLMYEAGRGIPVGSANQASDWYAKAVTRGDSDAAYRLGLMYELGRGVPKDLNEAKRLYAVARTPEASARLANLPQ